MPATAGGTARYTRTAIALHWLVAALILFEVVWGWWMQGISKQPPGIRADAFNLHKSIGLLLLQLMIVRATWLVVHRPPSLPEMAAWQRVAARGNHLLMYAVIFALCIGGYLGSAFSGYPVRFFGATLPAWLPASDAGKTLMSTWHLVLSWVLVTAVLLHVSAVMLHLRRDGPAFMGRMGWSMRTSR